jgi:hypothetical protein
MLDRCRPVKQTLEQRLSAEAKRLREQAKSLPHGALKEQLLRKARQAENRLAYFRVAVIAGTKSTSVRACLRLPSSLRGSSGNQICLLDDINHRTILGCNR